MDNSTCVKRFRSSDESDEIEKSDEIEESDDKFRIAKRMKTRNTYWTHIFMNNLIKSATIEFYYPLDWYSL